MRFLCICRARARIPLQNCRQQNRKIAGLTPLFDFSQGLVTSIADGKDYVGMCINIASRLQKLADDNFSFGFSRKGMEETKGQDWYEDFRLIKYKVRGITKRELIYVLKREFIRLSKEDQRKYGV